VTIWSKGSLPIIVKDTGHICTALFQSGRNIKEILQCPKVCQTRCCERRESHYLSYMGNKLQRCPCHSHSEEYLQQRALENHPSYTVGQYRQPAAGSLQQLTTVISS